MNVCFNQFVSCGELVLFTVFSVINIHIHTALYARAAALKIVYENAKFFIDLPILFLQIVVLTVSSGSEVQPPPKSCGKRWSLSESVTLIIYSDLTS